MKRGNGDFSRQGGRPGQAGAASCGSRRPKRPGARSWAPALKRRLQKETAARKKAEEALGTYREGLHNFLDAAPVAIAIYDSTGFLFSNKAHTSLVGAKTSDELVGRPVLDIIDPDFHEIFQDRTRQVRERGTEAPLIAYTCRRLDGRPVFLETIAIPFTYRGGPAVMGVAMDVSRRKSAERELEIQREQLMRAEKMALLGKLASGVAHEINNPNNYIALNASLLTNIWNDLRPILAGVMAEREDFRLGGLGAREIAEEIPRLAGDMLEGSRRITRIVKELKNFARPDLPETCGVIDLNQVVTTSLKLVDSVIKSSTERFSLELEPCLPPVSGHFHRLERVMMNLVMNACQALAHKRQAIVIHSEYDPGSGQVVVRVSDQGKGILPEHLSRITDPFFTTRREEGGTGLGLSISSRIVADYGGVLSFDSVPESGTTATLCFPALTPGNGCQP